MTLCKSKVEYMTKIWGNDRVYWLEDFVNLVGSPSYIGQRHFLFRREIRFPEWNLLLYSIFILSTMFEYWIKSTSFFDLCNDNMEYSSLSPGHNLNIRLYTVSNMVKTIWRLGNIKFSFSDRNTSILLIQDWNLSGKFKKIITNESYN